MRIAVGGDHRGVECRCAAIAFIRNCGFDVLDCGTDSTEPVDYPDIALDVAQRVAQHQADRGVLFCGTGIGVAIAANKVNGIRAAVCHDRHTAEMSRRHNDANVLCMSADDLDATVRDDMLRIWLATEFEGGRHQRRVDKIHAIESAECEAHR